MRGALTVADLPGRAVAVLAAAALLAIAPIGGCTGGQESPDVEHSGTQWVNAVCTDLGRWLDTVGAGASGGTAVAEASRRLLNAVEELQPPKTDDGNAAQGEVERLVESIRTRADQLPTPTLVQQVRASVDGIRNLTPGGVLEREFAHAPACEAVRG